jgi:hypothetical protein
LDRSAIHCAILAARQAAPCLLLLPSPLEWYCPRREDDDADVEDDVAALAAALRALLADQTEHRDGAGPQHRITPIATTRDAGRIHPALRGLFAVSLATRTPDAAAVASFFDFRLRLETSVRAEERGQLAARLAAASQGLVPGLLERLWQRATAAHALAHESAAQGPESAAHGLESAAHGQLTMSCNDVVAHMTEALTGLGRQLANSDMGPLAQAWQVEWPGVLGYTAVKRRLQDRFLSYFQQAGEESGRVRLQAPSGVVLHGSAGVGKSLLASCLPMLAHARVLQPRMEDWLRGDVGESERSVRETFAQARAQAPCFIILDNLEPLLIGRSKAGEATRGLVAQLLLELDNASLHRVAVILVCRSPAELDPALLSEARCGLVRHIRPDSQRGRRVEGGRG